MSNHTFIGRDMLLLAISLFVIAALFGLYVLIHILKDRPTPKPVVFIHGGIAATALLIVAYASYLNPSYWLVTSLIVFLVAATGGLFMFGIDMSRRPIPKAVAIIHPLIAVIGLLILIFYVIQSL